MESGDNQNRAFVLKARCFFQGDFMLDSEKYYEIFKFETFGDLTVALRAREGEPEAEPVILYDGGEHALLYRRQDAPVVLDYLNPDIRGDLQDAETVVITEYDEAGEMVREYEASLRPVKKLPISDEELENLRIGAA